LTPSSGLSGAGRWSTPPESVYVARCLGHENLIELDRSGGCALGRLGDGPGTVLLRSGQLLLSGAGGGPETTVTGSSFRGDRFHLRLTVGDMGFLVPSTEAIPVGSAVELSLGEDPVVPLMS